MENAFQLSIDSEGIGRLVFNLPGEKVNKFSAKVMDDLEGVLGELSRNNTVRALVISSTKVDTFIAGADIKEFTAIGEKGAAVAMAQRGQKVFQSLATLPFPTIALIDGVCLGGGLEMALACTYRIVTDHDKTSLGLPEVSLGLIPGWGGTQRLPRIVGLIQAMGMILSGKTVSGKQAWKMGLADAIVPREFQVLATEKFVKQCLSSEGKKKILQHRKCQGAMTCVLEKTSVGRYFVFKKAREDVMEKSKGNYPAPLAAWKVLRDTHSVSMEEGLRREADGIAGCFENPVAQNLIHLFFTSQVLKKESGVSQEVKPKEIRSVGVLGAGVMGGGIAWLFSKGDCSVRVKDIDWNSILKGFAAAQGIYDQLIKIKKMRPGEVNVKMHKITGTTEYTGFAHLDLVVEAVVENMEVKKKVLQELEAKVPADAIIASNTSALSITEMASVLKHPERFAGMHFFNPVNRMPLVEIIPSAKTSPETIATLVAVTKKTGKTPVVVKDCPGFLVNRILIPSLNEAGWLIQEGVDFQRIDKVFEKWGMPMGPFVLADEIGIDVAYKASKVLETAYGARMKVPEVFSKVQEKKFYGKKNGTGFYIHKGKARRANGEIATILQGLVTRGASVSDEEIIDRLVLVMVNEAAKCLEEKVIENPSFLDMAMIMGTGFPAFRGGLLKYADTIGIEHVLEKLQSLADNYGERFKPSGLLVTMSKNRSKFF